MISRRKFQDLQRRDPGGFFDTKRGDGGQLEPDVEIELPYCLWLDLCGRTFLVDLQPVTPYDLGDGNTINEETEWLDISRIFYTPFQPSSTATISARVKVVGFTNPTGEFYGILAEAEWDDSGVKTNIAPWPAIGASSGVFYDFNKKEDFEQGVPHMSYYGSLLTFFVGMTLRNFVEDEVSYSEPSSDPVTNPRLLYPASKVTIDTSIPPGNGEPEHIGWNMGPSFVNARYLSPDVTLTAADSAGIGNTASISVQDYPNAPGNPTNRHKALYVVPGTDSNAGHSSTDLFNGTQYLLRLATRGVWYVEVRGCLELEMTEDGTTGIFEVLAASIPRLKLWAQYESSGGHVGGMVSAEICVPNQKLYFPTGTAGVKRLIEWSLSISVPIYARFADVALHRTGSNGNNSILSDVEWLIHAPLTKGGRVGSPYATRVH